MGDGCCHGGGVDGLERGEGKNGGQMREIESLSATRCDTASKI